jgi:hypothetical protein
MQWEWEVVRADSEQQALGTCVESLQGHGALWGLSSGGCSSAQVIASDSHPAEEKYRPIATTSC